MNEIKYQQLGSDLIDSTLIKYGLHSAYIRINSSFKVGMTKDSWVVMTNLGITIPTPFYYTIHATNGVQINVQVLQNGDVQMYPRTSNVNIGDYVVATLPLLI